MSQWLPQSWAFFTRPPNDTEFVPYVITKRGDFNFASRLPNAKPENLFGLSRTQRAQGPEIANMANQVGTWSDCAGVDGSCVEVTAQGTAQPVRNSSTAAVLCGPVVLVETKPVPWSYRDFYEGWRMEKRAALVEAKCY